MSDHRIHGLHNTVRDAHHPSGSTANADLSSANWTATAVAADGSGVSGGSSVLLCPRAFIPNFAGTLVFKAKDDSADHTLIVNAGQLYPISIQSVTQASCSSALQVANALLLLY